MGHLAFMAQRYYYGLLFLYLLGGYSNIKISNFIPIKSGQISNLPLTDYFCFPYYCLCCGVLPLLCGQGIEMLLCNKRFILWNLYLYFCYYSQVLSRFVSLDFGFSWGLCRRHYLAYFNFFFNKLLFLNGLDYRFT